HVRTCTCTPPSLYAPVTPSRARPLTPGRLIAGSSGLRVVLNEERLQIRIRISSSPPPPPPSPSPWPPLPRSRCLRSAAGYKSGSRRGQRTRAPRVGPERWRKRDEGGAGRAGGDGALPVLRDAEPRGDGAGGGPSEVRGGRAAAEGGAAGRAGGDGALPVLRDAEPRGHGAGGGPSEVRGVRAAAAAGPADQGDGREPGPGGRGCGRAGAGGLLRGLVCAVQGDGAGAG